MSKLLLGLMSSEGDRLGHLVRGVQMLRSYGKEFDVDYYSDVVEDGSGALCCIVGGESDASPERVRAMARQTQWALGDADGNEILRVITLQDGSVDRPGIGMNDLTASAEVLGSGPALQSFQGLISGSGASGHLFVTGEEFGRICDWGQSLKDGETEIMGEWPSGVAEGG